MRLLGVEAARGMAALLVVMVHASAILAARHGLPRRDLYARALELSRGRT